MKKIIALFLIISLCSVTAIYAKKIYDDGAYWTVSEEGDIVNKNGYPPDEKLLQKHNQISIFTEEDIPFEEAEYKNGKIIKHKKTQQEIQAEVEQEEKATEYEVILNRMKKNAVLELETDGYTFKYDHYKDE